MTSVAFLGTSNSVPDTHHDYSHLVIKGSESNVLIDCGCNPILRLQKIGIGVEDLSAIIVTHFHPDHVSGLPLLLMNLWLMGRKNPIYIYGLDYTLDRIEAMMALFNWTDWPDLFHVSLNRIANGEKEFVLKNKDFSINASKMEHLIPSIGLRIEMVESGKTLAYSADTEPCEQMVRLAEKVDVLIHEVSGPIKGHSSAAQAGSIARRANVKQMYLIHYPAGENQTDQLVADASCEFKGPIHLAEDFLTINL